MKKIISPWLSFTFFILTSTLSLASFEEIDTQGQQPRFLGYLNIGDYEVDLSDYTSPYVLMSGDGKSFVGNLFINENQTNAFMLTFEDHNIGPLKLFSPLNDETCARQMNYDGTTIAGHYKVKEHHHLALWHGTHLIIPPHLAFAGRARALSLSGQAVVGTSEEFCLSGFYERACAFTSLGPCFLESTAKKRNSVANSVNADGTTIVGFFENEEGYSQACIYTPQDGLNSLDIMPGDKASEAFSICAKGSLIVLNSYNFSSCDSSSSEAYVYTKELQRYDSLGCLEGYDNSEGLSISGNGSTIIGHCTDESDETKPWLWRESSGIKALDALMKPYLPDNLKFDKVTSVSYDGKVFVGLGIRSLKDIEKRVPFVFYLP